MRILDIIETQEDFKKWADDFTYDEKERAIFYRVDKKYYGCFIGWYLMERGIEDPEELVQALNEGSNGYPLLMQELYNHFKECEEAGL